jgi:putative effector of murein hydrolase LrgA (UPF0299 family)
MLTWGSILLGFLVTVGLVAWDINSFGTFLQKQNVSGEEIKANTALMTRRLGLAFLPTFVGLLCGAVDITLLVLQSRRTAPLAKHPPQERA